MDANLHTIEGAYSYEYKGYYFAWLGNIWYLCQPCARKQIICLQAMQSLSICLQTYHSSQTRCLRTYHMFASQLMNLPYSTHAKRRLGKHSICIFFCRCIGSSEWWNGTFVLFYCWLEKGGAHHSSLPFSWAYDSAIFVGECVSLISAEYHFFIFQLTLTQTLADHCCHS